MPVHAMPRRRAMQGRVRAAKWGDAHGTVHRWPAVRRVRQGNRMHLDHAPVTVRHGWGGRAAAPHPPARCRGRSRRSRVRPGPEYQMPRPRARPEAWRAHHHARATEHRATDPVVFGHGHGHGPPSPVPSLPEGRLVQSPAPSRRCPQLPPAGAGIRRALRRGWSRARPGLPVAPARGTARRRPQAAQEDGAAAPGLSRSVPITSA